MKKVLFLFITILLCATSCDKSDSDSKRLVKFDNNRGGFYRELNDYSSSYIVRFHTDNGNISIDVGSDNSSAISTLGTIVFFLKDKSMPIITLGNKAYIFRGENHSIDQPLQVIQNNGDNTLKSTVYFEDFLKCLKWLESAK